MANLKNLKKPNKNRFGTPPSEKEAGNNLSAPETKKIPSKKSNTTPVKTRPARRTGRTQPFGTRVSPDFLKDFKLTALQHDLKFVELLEKSLEAFKRENETFSENKNSIKPL